MAVKRLVLITAGLNMSPVARLKKTVSFILIFVSKPGFLRLILVQSAVEISHELIAYP